MIHPLIELAGSVKDVVHVAEELRDGWSLRAPSLERVATLCGILGTVAGARPQATIDPKHTALGASMRKWLTPPRTLIGLLVATAIVAILVALVVPGRKWASRGAVTISVDVMVFEPRSATPIEGALVAIVWAPPATGEFELAEYQGDLSDGFSAIGEIGTRTNREGVATIPHEFRTGANHERPVSHAHAHWYWLLVSAEGYGSGAVPLRYESIVTSELKSQGRLPAYVGLSRVISE